MNNSPIAIVTGAGGGIGAAIALTLARSNWNIIVNDVNTSAADKTFKKITAANGSAVTICGDVGDEAFAKELLLQIADTFDRAPVLLVNNAGIQTWSTLTDLSLADWQRTINTNLTGCFVMTKEFAANAKAGSSIVNIGSGCNRLAFPGLVDYTASKGGIEMFTKSAALELGPRGIRVNCLAPGAIATDRTANETADYNARWADLTPLKRIGRPEDVANAVLLLADEKAAFITGQTIQVDGGLFSRAIWPDKY